MIKTKKILNNLRIKYEETEPSFNLKLNGWNQILPKLEDRQEPGFILIRRFAYAAIFLMVIAVLSATSYSVVKAALPGTPFYPVKILSENIINKVSGNNQASIDNRAEEIVNLAKNSNKNSAELKSVVIEYKKSVETAPKRDTEFQKKLDEQHKEFSNIIQEMPEAQHELKDAINISDFRSLNENHHDEPSGKTPE